MDVILAMMNGWKNKMLDILKGLFVAETLTLSNGKQVKEKFKMTPYIIIVLVILVVLCGKFTNFDFDVLAKKGYNFFTILIKMVPPNFAYAKTILSPMIDTLTMSVLGTLTGALIALPVAFISSSNLNKNKFMLWIIRSILSIIRTVPVLVYALILTYIFNIGTFAGFLAISIFTFSIASKMIYEQIETVDMGPYEAMESTGANKIRCVWCAIMPQITAYYYSMILYNFEMNVRSAAILGYVGAGGIGLLLNENIGWRQYSNVGMILVVLIITVVAIESTSRWMRKKLG